MTQAILTKRLPATDTRGQRVKAVCQAGSVTLSWDFNLGEEANHKRAAYELLKRSGWRGRWIGGPINTGGYRFCFVSVDGATDLIVEG